MAIPRFHRAFPLGRTSTPHNWESVDKEFERLYRLLYSLTDLTNATAESGGATADAEYVLGATHPGLPNGRVVTLTATISWDLATVGQAQANVIDDSITNAKLRDSAALSVIGRAANSIGNPADIVAGTASTVLRRNAADILEFAKVDLVDMANRSASILIGRGDSGAGVPQEITMGAGVTIVGTTLTVAEGGGHYEPLTDGDLTAPELLFARGDVIMAWVP